MNTYPAEARYTPEQAMEADRIYVKYRNGLISRRDAAPQIKALLDLTRGEVMDLLDDENNFPSNVVVNPKTGDLARPRPPAKPSPSK